MASTTVTEKISCTGTSNAPTSYSVTSMSFIDFFHSDLKYQGSLSRKSRNFTDHFWVSQCPLCLKNGEDLISQTSHLFFLLLPWKHVKRWASQNKRLAISQMAFHAQKVLRTLEKRVPGHLSNINNFWDSLLLKLSINVEKRESHTALQVPHILQFIFYFSF